MGPHRRCVIAMNKNYVNGCYGTSHLFNAHHGVNTIYTRYCVNKPSGYALGFITSCIWYTHLVGME